MKSLINRKSYVLIALGIILIPIGIGLIILACVAWNIGTKMERAANKIEDRYIGEDIGETEMPVGTDIDDETYKCDEYAPEVLEDGK